ncbi:MAG TPA: hypothetical protein VFQ60_01195 [Patescibacteria group bacterium]|nr:hypothetical protein [Patescibacteria group bacterium]
MRILVIDDTVLQIVSAEQCLKGHVLTFARTYDDAVERLQRNVSWSELDARAKQRGIVAPKRHDGPEFQAEFDAYWRKREELEESLRPPPFDAVLVDLMMPASRETMAGEGLRFAGELMPVGFALALFAIKQRTKFVAVLTATSHHDHPASAMLDLFKARDHIFAVDGARLGFFHAPWRAIDGTICSHCQGAKKVPDECSKEPGTLQDCFGCCGDGLARGKDWAKALAYVMGETKDY